MDLDSDNLIRQAPAVHAGRARGGIHSLYPSTGGFSGICTSSARAVVAWKPNSIAMDVSHFLSPSFHELLPLSTMP